MGLFSNKKTQADGFSFAVDEVYALKEGKSVVVTGKMTEGKVTPGTAAICLDSEGKPAFHCVIKGIEQGTQLMKMASADMKGTYGAHYGFKLDGVTKEQIPAEGAVLVSVTEELEEALKDAAPVSSVKAKASVENTVVVRDAQAQNATSYGSQSTGKAGARRSPGSRAGGAVKRCFGRNTFRSSSGSAFYSGIHFPALPSAADESSGACKRI